MPKTLKIHLWRCGDSEEGGEEPGVDCGMNYRHQRSACSIYVVHVPGGVTPGVATQPGEPGQGF